MIIIDAIRWQRYKKTVRLPRNLAANYCHQPLLHHYIESTTRTMLPSPIIVLYPAVIDEVAIVMRRYIVSDGQGHRLGRSEASSRRATQT